MKLFAPAGIVGSTLLAGCSIFCPTCPTPTPTPDQSVSAGKCLQANTKASTCEQRAGVQVCTLYVYSVPASAGTPASAVVYPYTLVVPPRQPAVIVWHLVEPRARFRVGDGPLNITKPREFENARPTEAADGALSAPAVASGRNFRIDYKNAEQSIKSEYKIQYHTGTGTRVECDPVITNEAG